MISDLTIGKARITNYEWFTGAEFWVISSEFAAQADVVSNAEPIIRNS
jgi:hypothetical protein